MPTEMINSINLWIPAIAALGGSFLTGAVAVLINHLNKKTELQKVRLEAMVKAGADQWMAMFKHKSETGSKKRLFPIESYILHLYNVSNVILDPSTNDANIYDRLRKVSELNDAATEYWEARHKENNPTM